MGKSDLREFGSRYDALILHRLNWGHHPDRRSPSWASTIVEQRSALTKRLRQSPGLKPHRQAEIAEAYPAARLEAQRSRQVAPLRFDEQPSHSSRLVGGDPPRALVPAHAQAWGAASKTQTDPADADPDAAAAAADADPDGDAGKAPAAAAAAVGGQERCRGAAHQPLGVL